MLETRSVATVARYGGLLIVAGLLRNRQKKAFLSRSERKAGIESASVVTRLSAHGRKGLLWRSLLLTVTLLTAWVSAAEPPVLECQSSWKALLEGEFADVKFAARNADPATIRLHWSFTVGTETLVSGHVPFKRRGSDLPTALVSIEMPDTKRKGVQSGTLKVSLVGLRDEIETATIEKTLWVFPLDPFEGREKWLTELDISLFDPEETTASELDAVGFLYESLESVDEIADEAASKGLLIVGEEVSFDEHPGLAQALLTVASQGRPVLCLAPADGSLPLPGLNEDKGSAPRRVAFRRGDAIAVLDPRLDADRWPGRDDIVASGFALRSRGDLLIAEFGKPHQRWPWLDVEYPTGRGRLIVCGFGVIRSWEEGATPRHLFAQLIELLTTERPPRDLNR